jgi:hypothetical protein
MSTFNVIVCFIALVSLGYFLIKEGIHKDTEHEKMIKLTQPPPVKRFPKWYAVVLGVICLGFALYFALKFFIEMV